MYDYTSLSWEKHLSHSIRKTKRRVPSTPMTQTKLVRQNREPETRHNSRSAAFLQNFGGNIYGMIHSFVLHACLIACNCNKISLDIRSVVKVLACWMLVWSSLLFRDCTLLPFELSLRGRLGSLAAQLTRSGICVGNNSAIDTYSRWY